MTLRPIVCGLLLLLGVDHEEHWTFTADPF